MKTLRHPLSISLSPFYDHTIPLIFDDVQVILVVHVPSGVLSSSSHNILDFYPVSRSYLDETVEQARANGYAQTMFGRKRHIPELRAANGNTRGFGERTAMNHPMQGSAAEIIKLAMRQVQERLMEEGFKARLLVQVHDELDFSVPRSEVGALSAMVREVMEGVVELKVPLIADVSNAPTWAEAH